MSACCFHQCWVLAQPFRKNTFFCLNRLSTWIVSFRCIVIPRSAGIWQCVAGQKCIKKHWKYGFVDGDFWQQVGDNKTLLLFVTSWIWRNITYSRHSATCVIRKYNLKMYFIFCWFDTYSYIHLLVSVVSKLDPTWVL